MPDHTPEEAPTPLPVQRPFDREGMGYVYRPPSGLGVVWHIDRITRDSQGIRARLRVEGPGGGHLYQGRHLLEGPNSIRDLIKALKELSQGSPLHELWEPQVRTLVRSVIESEEAGEPFTKVGCGDATSPQPDLVDKLLPYRATTQLYAPGGVGKGWLAVALGVHITLGQPFHGLAVQRGEVLYLDWEDEPETLDLRIKKLCRGLGVPPVEFHYRQCAQPLIEQVSQVAGYIARHPIELVIIDSAALAGGAGGGDRYEDVGLRLMSAIRHLHCTVLLVDHVASDSVKGGGPAKKGYGTVFKGNLCRATWAMVKEQELGSKVSRLGLFQTKVNRDADQLPLGFEFDFREPDRMVITRFDVRDEQGLAQSLTLRSRIDRILLSRGAHTVKALADILSTEDKKISEETVRTTLRRGEHEGRYVKVNDPDDERRVLWGCRADRTQEGTA